VVALVCFFVLCVSVLVGEQRSELELMHQLELMLC
jgi:hypothetical protein